MVSAFIGLGVRKETVSVAVADAGRNGEIRHLGNFRNTPNAVAKLARRLGRQHVALEFAMRRDRAGMPSSGSYPGLALFAASAHPR